MLGCNSYVIAKDAANENVLWVSEVWDNQASHDASLSLRAVEAVLPQVERLIVKLEKIAITESLAAVPS
jgi:quinol monooxygenase YgiN